MKRATGLLLVILFSLGLFWIVLAQTLSFTQPNWTVDNGGGQASGPNYTLFNTAGQPDVGVARSSNYQLQSGFWHSAGDRVLVLYALALDNLSTSNGNLTSYYYDVVEALLNVTRADSSKIAVLLVDLDGSSDTHILVIANGRRQLLKGLPDESIDCGALAETKNEFDMTNGEELGCFIQWARGNFRASKTLFSYVGHGVALAPAVDGFYCIVNGLNIPCSQPDSTLSMANRPGIPIVPTYKAVNPDWTDHHPEEGIVDPRLITPHALAVALSKGTNNGNNPLDVVDVTHCFAVSIEEIYELSFNPEDEQKPYARTLIGSPNYAYFAPELLAAFLSIPTLEQEALETAESIVAAYEAVLKTADESDEGDPDVDHPRAMVAVESVEVPPIKEAMDNLATELLANNNFDETKIMAAYTSSIKYDTTFCQGDWELAPPDALSDVGSFTQELANQYGTSSSVTTAANLVREKIGTAVITHTLTNGKPWFANIDPLPDWNFGDSGQTLGIGGYFDFQGITKTGEITTYLSFQSPWYTSTIHPEYPQTPYGFVVGQNKTWADLFYQLWVDEDLESELCLPEFPPLQHQAELSVTQILFPLNEPGMVSPDSPVQLSAVIQAENVAPNPLVEFTVVDSDGNSFKNTVNAGYLITGTHQVDTLWPVSDFTVGANFTVTVTVDPNQERFIDPIPENNTKVQPYQFPIGTSSERAVIQVSNKSGQWISEDEISLTVSQIEGDLITGVRIDTYLYEEGSPNVQVAEKVNEHLIYFDELTALQSVDLTPTIDQLGLIDENGRRFHGPVRLYIWGIRTSNFSVALPVLVKFNYAPRNTNIDPNVEHYYLFDIEEQGEHVHLDLANDTGDANLFVWDPLNLWNPTAESTFVGDDFVDFDAPVAGQYVLMVQGVTATQYTLREGGSSSQSGSQNRQFDLQESNSEVYIPTSRPVFLPPIPVPSPLALAKTCEELDQVTLVRNVWRQWVVRDMEPVTFDYARPPNANFVIINTGWRWYGSDNQLQVTEMHRVDTPIGSITSDDYGDSELGRMIVWYDVLNGVYAQDTLSVTIDYAGDGSDPGSHYSHGEILWCGDKDIVLPPTEYVSCEDIGLDSVGWESWQQQVSRDMNPALLSFAVPESANYAIVNTGWEWTGLRNPNQATAKHSVITPFGTTFSDDYGNENLQEIIFWYDYLRGQLSSDDLSLTVNYAGDGSDPGTHQSHGMIRWCRQ